MPLSADFQARKDAILNKNKIVVLGTCQYHPGPAPLKDATGLTWCPSCQQRYDLMNWGHAHGFPLVYVHPYAIAEGVWHWELIAKVGRDEAIQALLEGLQRVPEDEESA
jgi:hypothetical protein